MFKKYLGVGAILLAVLSSGCASVPMANPEKDRAAKTFTVKPGKANIYVYRNESFGMAIKMRVLLDGREVGSTGAKTYLLLEVNPGNHTLVSDTENPSTLPVNAVAGRNYFVWQEVKMGGFTASSLLQLVDETKGKAGVAECSLIEGI